MRLSTLEIGFATPMSKSFTKKFADFFASSVGLLVLGFILTRSDLLIPRQVF